MGKKVDFDGFQDEGGEGIRNGQRFSEVKTLHGL